MGNGLSVAEKQFLMRLLPCIYAALRFIVDHLITTAITVLNKKGITLCGGNQIVLLKITRKGRTPQSII